jgi:hypothetical protein
VLQSQVQRVDLEGQGAAVPRDWALTQVSQRQLAWQRLDSGWRGFAILFWAFAISIEVVVTILYWGAGIAIGIDGGFEGRPANQIVSSVLQHVMIVPLGLDLLLLSRMPILPAHALWLLLLFLAYIFTNVMYTTVGPGPIYSNITWANGVSYATVFIGFAILYGAFFAAWAIAQTKRRCFHYGDPRKRMPAAAVGVARTDTRTGVVESVGEHNVLVSAPRRPAPGAQACAGEAAGVPTADGVSGTHAVGASSAGSTAGAGDAGMFPAPGDGAVVPAHVVIARAPLTASALPTRHHAHARTFEGGPGEV